ncbi:hypothetical protein M2275_002892 [Rhodococcus opacus]|nr:hypothetical protein [Rhodococcus opacus]
MGVGSLHESLVKYDGKSYRRGLGAQIRTVARHFGRSTAVTR